MTSNADSLTMSLQTALHAATRAHHTNLNRAITARLPLCLPPNTSDPTAYYLGMLMFGHIFLSFEQAIKSVVSEPSSTDETRIRDLHLLRTLSTEGLPRSDVLDQDLGTLSGTLSGRLRSRDPRIPQIEARVRSQAVENTRHILKNIDSKPHLALAYTWTMYLALFNGGRWLYKQLAAAGSDFWLESIPTEHGDDNIQALSFWRFETSPQDPNAEELKSEFKRNFEQASGMLSSAEMDEVVREAVGLFDLCLRSISDLDTIMAGVNHDTQQAQTDVASEVKTSNDTSATSSVWQTISSTLLAPAYRVLNSRWARPMSGEVEAVN